MRELERDAKSMSSLFEVVDDIFRSYEGRG